MDKKRLMELAGIPQANITKVLMEGHAALSRGEQARLQELLTYYIDGWGGFPDKPDRYEQRVMNAIQHLHGVDLSSLSPDEVSMARDVLTYGSDV